LRSFAYWLTQIASGVAATSSSTRRRRLCRNPPAWSGSVTISTSAPRPRRIATFARVVFGSTTQVKRRPWMRAAIASAMPKLPELLSINRLPGGIDPSRRPASTM
jgi:hypothetical protein